MILTSDFRGLSYWIIQISDVERFNKRWKILNAEAWTYLANPKILRIMVQTINSIFLTGTKKLFQYYKGLGEKAIAQVSDEQINWKPNEASNSIALIVHHITGNMLSRFTDFLTS